MNRTLLLFLFLGLGCGDEDTIPSSDGDCDDGVADCIEDIEDGATYEATCVDGAWVFDENVEGDRQRCHFH